MRFDGEINIATGLSAKSKIWKNKKWKWSDFRNRLKDVVVTGETLKEYLNASKEEQLKIKDVGGYVGGYLRQGRRKPENVVTRQLVTLDIDFAHMSFWEDFNMMYDCAAIIHSTHKHVEESPRLRLVLPLSREVTSDEYVAISRKIAGDLGIDLFDNTTFETNRLMFWPSVPRDVEYYFEEQDGPWMDADEVLESYQDWTDSSLWPVSSNEEKRMRAITSKQEDPETKKGIVGAFCKARSIQETIANYLPDIYAPAGEDRYTYTKGSTAGGLMIYEDKFAYSHHGTDPCGGRLCNAFDLVRIHKYGHLDQDIDLVNEKAPSFLKMVELASEDKEVKKIIATEKLENVKYDFEDGYESEADDIEWMTELEVDRRGKYLATATNLKLILENDARLKDRFRKNLFDGRMYVYSSLPWRRIPAPEPIRNVDYSGLRVYIETIYGIVNGSKIEDALSLNFEKNSYHPIKQYIKSLEWDGTPRVDELLINFFGVEDTVYHREAIRKQLVGAVARVFKPGVKFDMVLTLVGPQGCGKSTFIKKLGKSWFSDTFLTVQGKEALEQIQGAWLIEIAELSGFRKAEVEAVKLFISKQEDSFRPAYARTPETYKRQCVFWGTTNNKEFINDPTGGRRFNPIDINIDNAKLDVFEDLTEAYVDQIWAEAYVMFKNREKLILSSKANVEATRKQMLHSETDERTGLVLDFLDMNLPKNWENMDLTARQMYLNDPESQKAEGAPRDYVCIAELWCELLGKNREDMSRYNTRDLNNIMKSLPGWEAKTSTRKFSFYGTQKYYERKKFGKEDRDLLS